MVLERVVLTDSGRILYCWLSDESFYVGRYSINEDRCPSDGLVISFDIRKADGVDYMIVTDEDDIILMELMGLDEVFSQMVTDWFDGGK